VTAAPLKVAVVGHTNTGKTSLMRTLMRDVGFGEVSDRPAVTREVEAAVLRVDGEPVLELFDTPGLEDSIGLLEHLDERRGDRRVELIDVIEEFLDGPEASGRFAQEAKAIRQVIASDVALYVIDVRDRVLGKHRDELEILGRCGRPVVPALNFTAADDARTATWREHLSRASMHVVAEFDTVVFSERDEQRLFEKMRTLLDAHRTLLDRLGADRVEQRRALVRSSARLLAETLVDVAAFVVHVPASAAKRTADETEGLRKAVRKREQRCVDDLLVLHRFRADDVDGSAGLPIEDGVWGLDLFSPAALKQFGLHAGGAAATGAMVGLTADIMFAGLSLGTGAAAGAAVGGLFGTARAYGRRVVDRMRGLTELRCDDATLRLLATRQLALIRALLRRGHASMEAIRLENGGAGAGDGAGAAVSKAVMKELTEARVHPHWSRLGPHADAGVPDPAREEAVHGLARGLVPAIVESPPR
jgi:hypothetical protein